MRTLLLPLVSLLLGAAFLLAGNGLQSTLVAVQLTASGFPLVWTGVVMGAYFVGFVSGTLTAARVIERVGHIRAFSAFAALLAAVALSHALSPVSFAWLGLRLLAGFCIASLFTVTESWLAAASSNEARGRVLSSYNMVVFLALGAGQLLLRTGDPAGIELFCLVGLLVSLAVVPVALSRTPAPELHETERLSLRTLLADSPLGAVAAVGSGVAQGAVYGMGPVFAETTSLPVPDVSTFMACLILGGLLLQWPIGRASDRGDRRVVLAAVSWTLVATAGGVVAAGRLSEGALLAATVLLGGLVFTLYPLGLAHTFDRLRAEQMLPATGAMLLLYGLGAAAGPPVASAAMGPLGPAGFLVATGAAAAAIGAYALFRIRRVRPAARHEPYRSVPRMTPVAGELDPRIDEEDGEAGPA